ncbi:hypothetical protein [Gracilibacillus sp. JCM 18860]|uniref:glycosyl hydrolase 2 galactose-binding domain-containing protein n=1 Tax=Gracilibacillus sp. JCM 18860 TaxID=1306159 RepID=UPI003260AD23
MLWKGENTILVYFHSPPIMHDFDKPDQLGYNLPADNDHSEDGEVEEKKLSVFARKAPYHYGWDWGPRFVTSGIWKAVYIEKWSKTRIRDVFIQQSQVTKEVAELKAVVEVESTNKRDIKLTIFDQHGFTRSEKFSLEKGLQAVELPFSIMEPPHLWWSNGLGEPYLYQFTLELSEEGTTYGSKQVKTGLRSIHLVQEQDQMVIVFILN